MNMNGIQKYMQKHTVKNRRKLFLMPCILLVLFLSGCARQSKPLSATGFYFDTVITITLYQPCKQELLDQCMELAEYYENLFSPNIEGSDIWRINHGNGDYVPVSEETLSLLSTALSYAELSDGLVDPAIGALSTLWNFGSDNQQIVPSEEAINDALLHTGYPLIEIKEDCVRLSDAHASVDLGFIAKGYIGDRMKEYLLSEGVTSATINLGGNVVALGQKPDGSPFKIGIQKPFESSGTTALVLELSDKSVVSSGNYERYFIQNDILYHHILSPQTGYPADSGLSQVTIISGQSVDGDALSTLCFILGYEKAARLLKDYPEIQAVFITTDGQIIYYNF